MTPMQTSNPFRFELSQALVCIMRRLVNIVYGMIKNKTEYRPFVVQEQAAEEQ